MFKTPQGSTKKEKERKWLEKVKKDLIYSTDISTMTKRTLVLHHTDDERVYRFLDPIQQQILVGNGYLPAWTGYIVVSFNGRGFGQIYIPDTLNCLLMWLL